MNVSDWHRDVGARAALLHERPPLGHALLSGLEKAAVLMTLQHRQVRL